MWCLTWVSLEEPIKIVCCPITNFLLPSLSTLLSSWHVSIFTVTNSVIPTVTYTLSNPISCLIGAPVTRSEVAGSQNTSTTCDPFRGPMFFTPITSKNVKSSQFMEEMSTAWVAEPEEKMLCASEMDVV
ncbi:hypothetical protein V8G54_029444 [Vigna mungo]|uniref:Uncharacterized protein n=1 Tax=Vigna mungo TaxID=3915 RepID=A0AAQ3RJ66_VIGMU